MDCPFEPIKVVAIVGKVGEAEYKLGETDDTGELTVDLDRIVDEGFVPSGGKERMDLVFDGRQIGKADLTALRRKREPTAWKTAVEPCREPSTSKSCNALRDVINNFPRSVHMAEARRVLDEAAPKLREHADDERYQGLHLPSCSKPETEDPSMIEIACDPLEQYLSDFPEGKHVREVRAALDRGKRRVAAINASIERACQAEQSQIAAEAAAAQRKQDEEERRQREWL